MKLTTITAAAAILAICSCSKTDNIPGANETKSVDIPASAYTSFNDGDAIGLYLTYSSSENGSEISGDRFLDNIRFVKSGDRFVSDPQVFYPEDASVFNNLYTYFPYQEDFIGQGESTALVKVSADQSSGTAGDDFKYAVVRNFKSTEGIPELTFRHAFAKINIEVKAGGYYENLEEIPEDRNVTVSGTRTECTFDFETEEMTLSETVEEITPYGQLKADGSSLKGMYFIIPPQTVSAGSEFIVFTMGKDIFRLRTEEDITFESGTESTLTVTLNADFSGSIINVNLDITDWSDGESFDMDEDEILPPEGTTVTDIDGNIYEIVRIGKQYWMASNLRVTRLNDGTPMVKNEDISQWRSHLSEPTYTAYNNDYSDAATYGLLYNRTAVETDRICPEGWHVPSGTDWDILGKALGGTMDEYNAWLGIASSMKSSEGWGDGNNGTNESGFNAYPAGYLFGITDENGNDRSNYYYKGENARFWSFSAISAATSFVRGLNSIDPEDALSRFTANNESGYSVRCVHDF